MELVVVADGGEAGLDQTAAAENKQTTSDEKKKVLSTFELWSHIAIYIGLFICVFFFVGSIVAYFVFTDTFRERINAIDDVRSSSSFSSICLILPPSVSLALI
jgi:NAD/NADP transhydrogenase beta subunit